MEAEFWIISYDVSDARRLRKVARVMERFGARVQKSVFECWLTGEDRRALEEALQSVLQAPPDNVRFYPLCADCRQKAKQDGHTEIMEIRSFYIV